MVSQPSPARHVERGDWVFRITCAALLAAAGAVLLWLNTGMWFAGDEFHYMDLEQYEGISTLERLLAPHNEHFPLLTKLWFQALLPVVGLHAYWVYSVGAVVAHLLAGLAVLAIVSRHTHRRWLALVTAALALLAGVGAENLLWAGQLQFILPVAIFLGWIALRPPEHAASPFVFVAAVLAGVIGVFGNLVYLPLAAALALGEMLQRRRLLAAVLIAVPVGIWLGLLWHFGSPTTARPQAGIGARVLEILAFVGRATLQPLADTSGSLVAGAVLLGVAVLGLAVTLAKREWDSPIIVLWAGIVLSMSTVGYGRAAGADLLVASRYMYVVWFLLVAILGLVAGQVLDAVRSRALATRVAAGLVMAGLAAWLAVGGAVQLGSFYGDERAIRAPIEDVVLGAARLIAVGPVPPPETLVEPVRDFDLTSGRLTELVGMGLVPTTADVPDWAVGQARVNMYVELLRVADPEKRRTPKCRRVSGPIEAGSGDVVLADHDTEYVLRPTTRSWLPARRMLARGEGVEFHVADGGPGAFTVAVGAPVRFCDAA